jgi:hypothetical protein
MPIGGNQFGGQAADVTELLALPGLWRGVESQPALEHDAALVAEMIDGRKHTSRPPMFD